MLLKRAIGRILGGVFARLLPRLTPYLRYAAFTDAVAEDLVSWEPDVIHAHDLHTLPTGAALAERTGAALIYDSHELETHRQPPPPPLRRKFIERLERRTIANASAVITVSDSIADHLADLYRIDRPLVILNAPASSANGPSPADRTVRQEAGLQPGVPLLLYVGSVTMNRGIDVALRALARMPEGQLVTVGPMRAETVAELRALAGELGVTDRFHLLPPVPNSELVSFIRDADIGLIPIMPVTLSYRYAMPNKLFEMAFAGMPIVASDLPEIRRFIERYDLGAVYPPGDDEALAAVLQKILADMDAFRPGTDTVARLRAENGWDVQTRVLEEAYRRASAGPVNRPERGP